MSYQQDPTHNVTNVYVALAGDASPDMEIQLGGLLTLSAANFALTPAQSSADLTAGASLGVSVIRPAAGGAREYVYTGVSGRPYSSYESIESGWDGVAETAADDLNLSSSANELDLYQGNLTIARSSAAEDDRPPEQAVSRFPITRAKSFRPAAPDWRHFSSARISDRRRSTDLSPRERMRTQFS